MIPVINPTTSIPDYEQHESWTYQPFATGKPTLWRVEEMAPPGMAFNPVTGALSGACHTAGIYVLALYAGNEDGESEPLVLTVGIYASPQDPRSLHVDVDIDLVFRTVTVAGVSAAADYQHAVKAGDDLIYTVRFFKAARRVDPAILKLAWTLKTDPDETTLAASDAWAKTGYGDNAAWSVHGKLDDAILRGELSDTDVATTTTAVKLNPPPLQQFLAHVEFEWLQSNNGPGAVGPDPLRGSSQPMRVLLVNDQAEITPPDPS